MAAQTKNYMEGPDKWVINGALAFGTGATVTGLAADPLLPATDEQLGGVIVGEGLEVTEDGVLSAAVATDETAGAVIVGEGLEVTEDGVLSVEAPLIPATADTLGGVKVGEGLSIDESGVLSAEGDGIFYAHMSVNDDAAACDKTLAELEAAYNAGKNIVAVYDPSGVGMSEQFGYPLYHVKNASFQFVMNKLGDINKFYKWSVGVSGTTVTEVTLAIQA